MISLDIHQKVANNPDDKLTIEDVKAWEAKHGQILAEAFVAFMPRQVDARANKSENADR